MATIDNGTLIDAHVELKISSSLEHGALDKVRAIVLHRTAAPTASGTLAAYEQGNKVGAHFLIAQSGQIYQTASMDQRCWHVGILFSRCRKEGHCEPKELKTITALLHEQGASFAHRVKNVSRRETQKAYPLRYPTNDDSLGIEVVGRFLASSKTFAKPTVEQLQSLKWLVDTLVSHFGLSLNNDVYAHGAIARKEPAEGAQILQYILSGSAL